MDIFDKEDGKRKKDCKFYNSKAQRNRRCTETDAKNVLDCIIKYSKVTNSKTDWKCPI